jgi:hypothetical protein
VTGYWVVTIVKCLGENHFIVFNNVGKYQHMAYFNTFNVGKYQHNVYLYHTLKGCFLSDNV